ncbi:MAG: T9SS type A sorting domain-containing protein [Bacteroidetes bacterium]|nr:T9SS type A sorting domain-containing protein [Bacteroidota bacterium]
MKSLALLLFVCFNTSMYGQKNYGKIWVCAKGGQRVHFNSNVLVTATPYYASYFTKGNSNICDSSGNLMLCSDGYNVYDSNTNYIDGGDTIVPKDFYVNQNGFSVLSQSSIFLPLDSDLYYFVTPTMSNARYADCIANNNCHFDLLLYNIIDMKANAGAGKVIKRMVPLMQNASLSKTQMMACRHSNGKDWWLLKQGGDSNKVYKFLFTQDSVFDYGLQSFAAPYWGAWDIMGQSVFTQDGSLYASTCQSDGLLGEIFMASFNRCTGELFNHYVIAMPSYSHHEPSDTTIMERTPAGLAFSPNNRFLYVMGMRNIFQYDLLDSTWFHVVGLDTSYIQFQDYSASYLGPDGKIYVGNFGGLSKQMSVIDAPDNKGAACSFCPRCLRFPNIGAGTPPCMPNYALGEGCWPLGSSEIKESVEAFKVYPNPANNYLFLESDAFNKEIEIIIYNVVGQEVLKCKFKNSNSKIQLDIHSLSQGIYLLKVGSYVRKFLKE